MAELKWRKWNGLRNACRLQARVTAIRLEQSVTRAKAEVVDRDAKFDLIKINPLARWSNMTCGATSMSTTLISAKF